MSGIQPLAIYISKGTILKVRNGYAPFYSNAYSIHFTDFLASGNFTPSLYSTREITYISDSSTRSERFTIDAITGLVTLTDITRIRPLYINKNAYFQLMVDITNEHIYNTIIGYCDIVSQYTIPETVFEIGYHPSSVINDLSDFREDIIFDKYVLNPNDVDIINYKPITFTKDSIKYGDNIIMSGLTFIDTEDIKFKSKSTILLKIPQTTFTNKNFTTMATHIVNISSVDIPDPIPPAPGPTPPEPWKPNPPTPPEGQTLPKANIFTNNSDKEHIDKDLTTIADYDFVFKQPTDVLNPIITISGDKVEDIIGKANYFYIDKLHRYYYITDMTIIRSGLVQLSGHVDVLMSYKDEIRAQKAIVQSQKSKFNLYLDDPNFRMQANPIIKTKKFPSGFKNHAVILAVGGGEQE